MYVVTYYKKRDNIVLSTQRASNIRYSHNEVHRDTELSQIANRPTNSRG